MIKQINRFSYKKELGQNCNIGFMSFQHFNGEKLYSDLIVKPENNMTETETVECYPISGDAMEQGREQGYYPKSSIAYFRILWKEWEPERGKFNVDFVRNILNGAKSHNQTVFFRLMPHSTRACDDVPEWLKAMIDCPVRPDGKRVKDSPTDPLFIKLFSETVRVLGKHFDSDPTFYSIDISLPGAWGEGHKLELYSEEDIRGLCDVYVESFPNTRLTGQLIRTNLISYMGKKCKVGIRGDGYGEPVHIHKVYPTAIEKLGDMWKTVPVSFETYWWFGEWYRQGWDIDEIIELSLKWHVSSVNGKSMPIPYEWKEKVDNWISKMGYHFVIDSFAFPDTVNFGDVLQLELTVNNIGVAPLYDDAVLYVTLVGENTYIIKTDVDVTRWLPGKYTENINIILPDDLNSGTYNIALKIHKDDFPPIYFASDAPLTNNGYIVGKFTVQSI